MDIVLGIILLIAAVFLIVAVLMQNGKAHKLSGSIAGGAETFFGKTKGSAIDRVLSKVTSVVAIVFCLIVLLMYMFQSDDAFGNSIIDPSQSGQPVSTGEVVDDTTAAEAADTTAAAE